MKILLLLLILSGSAIAVDAVYTYRCTECGLIQQFSYSGVYHCPKDNTIMVAK
jgi:hypothetical protein